MTSRRRSRMGGAFSFDHQGEQQMLLHTALIICQEPKTDDQLKEIMSSHPWLIHGFRNVTQPWDRPDYWRQHGSIPDSIYAEGGLGMSRGNWLDRSFEEPNPIFLRSLPDDPINDPTWRAVRK